MEEKLLKIINHYGYRNQLKKLSEEVYELQEAINNYMCYVYYPPEEYLDKDYNEYLREHIAEEIADCMVLIEQFKNYYDISSEEKESEYANICMNPQMLCYMKEVRRKKLNVI